MSRPSERYSLAIASSSWSGPCADSFCYASCDSPSCRYELRLGKTPKEHNAKLMAMQEAEIVEARALLEAAGCKVVDPAPPPPKSFVDSLGPDNSDSSRSDCEGTSDAP